MPFIFFPIFCKSQPESFPSFVGSGRGELIPPHCYVSFFLLNNFNSNIFLQRNNLYLYFISHLFFSHLLTLLSSISSLPIKHTLSRSCKEILIQSHLFFFFFYDKMKPIVYLQLAIPLSLELGLIYNKLGPYLLALL